MRKARNEKNIIIKKLLDSELANFAPPIKSCKENSSIEYLIKKKQEKQDFLKGYTPKNKNLNLNIVNYRNSSFITSVNEYIGEGGFSKVYKFVGDPEHKAIKKIMTNPKIYSQVLNIEDSVKREVFGMIKCECENSVKLYDAYQSKDGNSFYLLMEQCHGNINKLIQALGRPLNTLEIKELLSQLNNVFFQLYKNNIIHRDIKPTNILYIENPDKNNPNEIDNKRKLNHMPFKGKKYIFKLTDYGVCLPLYDSNFSQTQFMGTLDFMAPEIYSKKTAKEHPIYTVKIDLFSLGQTILNLMGYIKNPKPLNAATIEQIKNQNFLHRGTINDRLLYDLIFNNLLIADPEERIGWELYFFHPFFDES